jgi:transposase
MDIIYSHCAGLDVHQATVVACVRIDGRKRATRTYDTTTTALEAMRLWFIEEGVTAVAMESTGVFWKPVFNILEGYVDNILLCNAHHLKAVPGRKTDVLDAEWIAQLLQAGLLRGSFVPNRHQRELRDLNRERAQLQGEQTRVTNRLHKVLQDANIKLTTYVTDIMGVSGREMLGALVGDDFDPAEVAKSARGRMRPKIPQIVEALRGHVTEHHRFMIEAYLRRHDAAETEIAALDARIESLTRTDEPSEPPRNPQEPAQGDGDGPDSPDPNTEPTRKTVSYGEAIALLDTIPGVNPIGARRILAEIGVDMTQFPSAGHLASWAGLCPGNNVTSGKSRGGKIRKGSRWLRAILGECAWAATRTKNSYFKAAYSRWAARRGKRRAIVSVMHAMLRSVYFMLRRGVPYKDLGPDWFDQLTPARTINSLTKRARKLGYALVPVAPETAL